MPAANATNAMLLLFLSIGVYEFMTDRPRSETENDKTLAIAGIPNQVFNCFKRLKSEGGQHAAVRRLETQVQNLQRQLNVAKGKLGKAKQQSRKPTEGIADVEKKAFESWGELRAFENKLYDAGKTMTAGQLFEGMRTSLQNFIALDDATDQIRNANAKNDVRENVLMVFRIRYNGLLKQMARRCTIGVIDKNSHFKNQLGSVSTDRAMFEDQGGMLAGIGHDEAQYLSKQTDYRWLTKIQAVWTKTDWKLRVRNAKVTANVLPRGVCLNYLHQIKYQVQQKKGKGQVSEFDGY